MTGRCAPDPGPHRLPPMRRERLPEPCPACTDSGIPSLGGSPVPQTTLASLVPAEHRERIRMDEAWFCPRRGCDVVYFDRCGGRVDRHHLRVRVWQKETTGDLTVCYCFGHTADEIVADARANPRPTIPDRILEHRRRGECACERTSPRGVCCLGDVARWIKHAGHAGGDGAMGPGRHAGADETGSGPSPEGGAGPASTSRRRSS